MADLMDLFLKNILKYDPANLQQKSVDIKSLPMLRGEVPISGGLSNLFVFDVPGRRFIPRTIYDLSKISPKGSKFKSDLITPIRQEITEDETAQNAIAILKGAFQEAGQYKEPVEKFILETIQDSPTKELALQLLKKSKL